MKLTMCIVGCGGYARNVLGDIHDMTDEFDYYFASRDMNKAQQYSEDFGGVGAFGDYEEAAADPRVQSLYFFTPHDTHLDNVKLAARHGKHILMEKPIARTLDEAQEMIQIARDAGVKLMVAENYRFLLTVDKALEIMRQGPVGDSFGELRQIELQAEGYSVPKEWRSSAELNGGGVVIRTSPSIASALEHAERSTLRQIRSEVQAPVSLLPDGHMHQEQFEVVCL